jgi:CRP/FNR family transcriptional regulator, cyclic AMP receptor protein
MVDEPSASLRDVLKQNFLFASLSDQELDALCSQVWVEQFPPNTIIVREGDVVDALYLVVDGGVNVAKQDGQFLAYLGRGGFFGEMALFSEGATRSASCIATRETTCAVLRKDTLHDFCSKRPDLGVKIYRVIIRTLSERLQATSADLAMLMRAQVKPQDVVARLVDQAKAAKHKT